jgi:hypothetical protein
MMQRSKDKPPAGDVWDLGGGSERRRISKIVHDERGNARVEWVDAPPAADGAEAARPTLSIHEPEPSVHRGYDPYSRVPRTQSGATAAPKREPTSKRDLRKLSDWIKQMRVLEERKRAPDEDE